MTSKTILFIRNGEFSFTNRLIFSQLEKQFPDDVILNHDVADDTLHYAPFFVINTIISIFKYGVRAVLFEKSRYFYFIRTRYFFKYAARRHLNKLKREGRKIDVVVQTQGLFNGAMSRVPLVVYTDYTMKSPSYGGRAIDPGVVALEAALFARADAITVTANHVRDILISDYGCAPGKVRTVYIGSNALGGDQQISPARFASKTICFVGIDWIRKGGEDLVLAFMELLGRMPDARLIIAGASPSVQHPQIEVLGKVPREAVADLYRTSAVFCLPSHVEPSSVAAIEAATYGLPIVATRVGGFLDSVVDGVSGLLVASRNPHDLANALFTVLNDPEVSERMGEAGAENARSRFNWDSVGQKIADVVRSEMGAA